MSTVDDYTLTKNKIDNQLITVEQGQVTVHLFLYSNYSKTNSYNIDKRIHLVEQISGIKRYLVFKENIVSSPNLIHVPAGYYLQCILVFDGLSKNCNIFSILEPCIKGRKPFNAITIPRTKNDIYYWFIDAMGRSWIFQDDTKIKMILRIAKAFK